MLANCWGSILNPQGREAWGGDEALSLAVSDAEQALHGGASDDQQACMPGEHSIGQGIGAPGSGVARQTGGAKLPSTLREVGRGVGLERYHSLRCDGRASQKCVGEFESVVDDGVPGGEEHGAQVPIGIVGEMLEAAWVRQVGTRLVGDGFEALEHVRSEAGSLGALKLQQRRSRRLIGCCLEEAAGESQRVAEHRTRADARARV